jgi:hypothetical protein
MEMLREYGGRSASINSGRRHENEIDLDHFYWRSLGIALPTGAGSGEAEMTPILSKHGVQPTSRQKLAMRKMLRSLLGEIDFKRLCLGIEVGALDEDALQIFVLAENCAADIKRHHSDDFAVAAEYALGRPIRTVNVSSAH